MEGITILMPGKNHFISPPAAAALGPAFKALEEKNYAEALKLATAYLSDTNPTTSLEAAKAAALAHFQLGDFSAAAPLFSKVALGSSTPHNWLNVLTSLTLAKKPDGTKDILETVEKVCAQPPDGGWEDEPSFAFVLYYFIQALCDTGEFAKAQEELNRLAELYNSSLHAHTQNLPPLTNLLELAVRVFSGQKQLASLHIWLDQLSPKVSNTKQEQILKLKNKLPQPQ